MLSATTIQKLKQLEIDLETSLIDLLDTQVIIETIIERINIMHNEGFLDELELIHLFATAKSIIYEEEHFAKIMLGNCVGMLDSLNYCQKAIELSK